MPLSPRRCFGRCGDDLGGLSHPACQSLCPVVSFCSLTGTLGGTGTCRCPQGSAVAVQSPWPRSHPCGWGQTGLGMPVVVSNTLLGRDLRLCRGFSTALQMTENGIACICAAQNPPLFTASESRRNPPPLINRTRNTPGSSPFPLQKSDAVSSPAPPASHPTAHVAPE